MTIVYIFGAAAIFFIVGIGFIVRGMRAENNEVEAIAPITKEETSVSSSQKSEGAASPQPNNLTSHIVKENLTNQTTAAASQPSVNDSQLTAKIDKLKEELDVELKKVSELSAQIADLQGQLEKKDEQHAVLVKQLENENNKLREENKKLNDDQVTFLDIKKKNENLQTNESESKAKITKLEVELQAMQDQVNTLNAKGQDAQETLEKENQDLKMKLQQSEQKIKELEENINLVKMKGQEQAEDAQKELAELKTKQEAAAEEKLAQGEEKVHEAVQKLDELKAKLDELSQANQDLQNTNNELKAHNEQLVNREKIVQYELTKMRAQALGLEKICEDFKVQIEETHKTEGMTNGKE